ncbi:MAG: aldo/keto reductase, partial [Candidatus Kapaibacterium sp.]
GALADMQREGKIQHIGVSNFSLEQLERVIREAEIVSIQNQFSVINQREDRELLEFCERNTITYLPWNPVGGRGKATDLGSESDALDDIAQAHKVAPHTVALAWLLGLSPAIIPIPGTTKAEHVAENMRAAELKLSDEEMKMLSRE